MYFQTFFLMLNANVNLSVVCQIQFTVSQSATKKRGGLPTRQNWEHQQPAVQASVGLTSHLQNVTFLQNAFMVTFFTYLGIEGLKYFIGQLQFEVKI